MAIRAQYRSAVAGAALAGVALAAGGVTVAAHQQDAVASELRLTQGTAVSTSSSTTTSTPMASSQTTTATATTAPSSSAASTPSTTTGTSTPTTTPSTPTSSSAATPTTTTPPFEVCEYLEKPVFSLGPLVKKLGGGAISKDVLEQIGEATSSGSDTGMVADFLTSGSMATGLGSDVGSAKLESDGESVSDVYCETFDGVNDPNIPLTSRSTRTSVITSAGVVTTTRIVETRYPGGIDLKDWGIDIEPIDFGSIDSASAGGATPTTTVNNSSVGNDEFEIGSISSSGDVKNTEGPYSDGSLGAIRRGATGS